MKTVYRAVKIWLLGLIAAPVEALAFVSHPEGHPSQGYEIIAIVDKAERYRGANSRLEVAAQKGQLVSETGQTLSLFVLGADQGDGVRRWKLAAVWDVSTGREVQYQVKLQYNNKTVTAQAATPTGFFPVKMIKIDYVSWSYGEAMPYSVGYYPEFGAYIHQTRDTWCDKYIGTRRSAGCTRLCAEEAQSFFKLVESRGMGLVLAFDDKTGLPLRDRKTGGWRYVRAYRTLVINTDSTPEPLRRPVLPILMGRPVISIDPRRYVENPELLRELLGEEPVRVPRL